MTPRRWPPLEKLGDAIITVRGLIRSGPITYR
jgi:hypothetical protein